MQLISWNTQWCCGVDGKVDPARIVQELQSFGACDVLCLQEIAVNYPGLKGGPQDQLAQLQALLPEWQFFYSAAVDEFTAQGRQRFGNLIATRLPVLQVQHVPLPYPADAGVRSMQRICTVVTVQDPHIGPVRVMTTHLEYFSDRQRMSQARYLRRMHFEALSHVYAQPEPFDDGSPFQTKPHTPHAVLCGDFNMDAQAHAYEALASRASVIECLDAGWPEQVVGARWNDAWPLVHGSEVAQPHTFNVYDQTFGQPVACDFVWVSDSLRDQVRSFAVQEQTQASDHQPVRVTLGH